MNQTQAATIALDLDNTAADFTAGLRSFIAEQAGLSEREALELMPNPTHYHVGNWQLEELGFTGFLHAFRAAEANQLYLSLKPAEHAVEAVAELTASGHNVIAMTARPEQHRAETQAWLSEYLPMVSELIHTEDKAAHSVVNGGEFQLFIDDAPEQIQSFIDCGADVLVAHQPYNQDFVEGTVGRLTDFRNLAQQVNAFFSRELVSI